MTNAVRWLDHLGDQWVNRILGIWDWIGAESLKVQQSRTNRWQKHVQGLLYFLFIGQGPNRCGFSKNTRPRDRSRGGRKTDLNPFYF